MQDHAQRPAQAASGSQPVFGARTGLKAGVTPRCETSRQGDCIQTCCLYGNQWACRQDCPTPFPIR